MAEPFWQTGIRLSRTLVDAIDAFAVTWRKANPGVTFTRSDSIRMLINRGLAASKGEK